jgi:phosphoribosyl-ATP pyrophosphohydrolase
MVLWRARGLDADEVWGELERRFGAPPRAGSTQARPSRSADGS